MEFEVPMIISKRVSLKNIGLLNIKEHELLIPLITCVPMLAVHLIGLTNCSNLLDYRIFLSLSLLS